MKSPKELEYIGNGALPGVPARDLTADEVKKHGGKTALLKTGLWQEVKASKTKKDGK